MFALTEIRPVVEVTESEYQRLLGYPEDRRLEGRARELADQAQEWFSEHGHPWIAAREIDTVEIHDHGTRIGGADFSSRRLRGVLSEAQAHRAVLVAASAGKECEEYARQLWLEDKPDEYFFLESYGSAVVEQLLVQASARICGWADANQMAALPHFSPGYSGWNIAEQVALLDLFENVWAGTLPGKLEALDSGMLWPKKSQLAVVGLTRDLEKARRFARLIPCENCLLGNCRYRRAPYRRSPALLK